MKKLLLFITLLFSTSLVFAQKVSEKKFQKEIEPYGLHFEMPDGFKPTKIKENKDLGYSFAMLSADEQLEVRYTLYPLEKMVEEYEASLDDPNVTMADPNILYKSLMMANVMNLSGGEMHEMNAFDEEDAKNEFGADAGMTSVVPLDSQYGEGYEFATLVALHLDDEVVVFAVFLGADIDTYLEQMAEVFYSLKFFE